MCGIAGYFDKKRADAPVGAILLAMLTALVRRGPDSAGAALFGPREARGEICWVKLPEVGNAEDAEATITEKFAARGEEVFDLHRL